MDSKTFTEEDLNTTFGAVEYVVFGIVLALPAAIGVFHGCFGTKQNTTDAFLMANRSLSAFPVALSLICSFISPITLLGNPAEIYLYGVQITLMMFSFIPLTLTVTYLFLPVYFNLGIKSAYEYLQIRFNKGASVFVSLLAITHMTVFQAILVYGPALALEQVTGIDLKITSAAIFAVGIFYSAIGGLKAVVWNDTLQVIIMFSSLTAIIIKGYADEGGMSVVWERAQNTSRAEFFNFDPDPRTRHTFWTAIIGGFFYWMPMYGSTQQRIQRYLSLPSLATVRRALIINMIGIIIFSILCMLAGLVVYSRFHDCDPLAKEIVTNSDQLLPLLAMQTSRDMKGLAGLFVAGLTSASLSFVSGALSGLASIMTYDYISKALPETSDQRLAQMSKVVTVAFGCLGFGLIFVVEKMGNILPVTSSLIGAILGPSLGIFTLGMFFPWANAKGALTGVVTVVVLMMSFAVGNFVANNEKLLPDQRLPLSVYNCPALPGENATWTSAVGKLAEPDWKDQEYSPLAQLLSISYLWHPMIGSFLTIFLGLIFSFIFSLFEKSDGRKLVAPELLSPPIYALLKKIVPSKSLSRFVGTRGYKESKEARSSR